MLRERGSHQWVLAEHHDDDGRRAGNAVHHHQTISPRREGADPNIDRALQWLGDHFEAFFANGIQGVATQYYGLYGLERIGVACGRRDLGTHDWFAEGADWLVQRQNADGSWGTPGDLWGFNARNVLDTVFAILFLARGRAPVVMEKVQYAGAEGRQDRTRSLEPAPARPGQSRPLDEQSARAGPELADNIALPSPWKNCMMRPSSSSVETSPWSFPEAEKAKLQQFVEEGGMILGNADGDSKDFSASFQKLGVELFPGLRIARSFPTTTRSSPTSSSAPPSGSPSRVCLA